MNHGANLVAQLDIERNVALGLEMQGNHWPLQSGQSIVSSIVVKSQIVFSRTGFNANVAPRFRASQRLKPHSFRGFYGTAEAVPHKDLFFETQAIQSFCQ
jgi:hypothetical protein